ncbi:hypothetical protein AVEN_13564-1 [Araneus ventricosus]|uniref:RNase H type-1 domain-containing protein n=1 Tax=Araneus ventricosus TaxID=182803 RepID=A0A4Y2D5F4_ARAVE|nr:hypothetical protein AVEN_13564-1 [Araneus ventricosus]
MCLLFLVANILMFPGTPTMIASALGSGIPPKGSDYAENLDVRIGWGRPKESHKYGAVKCVNCIESNERFRTIFITNHSCLDRRCQQLPETRDSYQEGPIMDASFLRGIHDNERNNTSFYTQAFADDLALIISGRTARELEANTNIALAEIAQHLQEIKLSLSVHKCQALKALLYGASIWGGALTKHHISRLHSFQRVFLLRFTRAYKTTSTNVLNVLTGIPPLHITAKAEFCKFQIWVRRSLSYNHIINNIPLDYNINIRNIPSEQKSIVLPSTIQEADFEVYTDGSRIDNETGLAVCTFQQNDNVSNFLFKLNSYNSVFQAELEAIHFACNWALQNNYKINIHTDSLSSILAIQSANSRSGFVYSVKQDIFKARHLVGLSWVKAHVGIPGNEWADQQAKSAINLGIEKLIPAPRSFLRRALKQQILNEWNEYFMNYNSASGARARDFIDKVDFNFFNHQ